MKHEIEARGKFSIIHIIGNIDTQQSTKILDGEISKMIAAGHHHFVFNLDRTTYLDSAGISIFIHCLCDVQENNGSIYIVARDSQVSKVLEMVGINRLIKTYASEAAFLAEHKVDAP
jgi:anti-sigma B factor antagonist